MQCKRLLAVNEADRWQISTATVACFQSTSPVQSLVGCREYAVENMVRISSLTDYITITVFLNFPAATGTHHAAELYPPKKTHQIWEIPTSGLGRGWGVRTSEPPAQRRPWLTTVNVSCVPSGCRKHHDMFGAAKQTGGHWKKLRWPGWRQAFPGVAITTNSWQPAAGSTRSNHADNHASDSNTATT